ncbi:MAG: hypothetical protein EBT33_13575, partial [Betaproteobacteria bacterium]|nr:hypothetical protein [Betaproteobacteria bacterium]
IHHTTVRRVLAQAGLTVPARTERPAKVDPYVPLITLQRWPTLSASRLPGRLGALQPHHD